MARFKEQKNVPINRLKPAKYNPPGRTSKEACKKLMHAMETMGGTLYPIVVDNDMNIIEGHRRWFSAKYLGWKTVDVMILGDDSNGTLGSADRDLVYSLINDTGRKHSTNDKMYIYLREANAINQYMRGRIQRVVDEIGMDLFKRLQRDGYSLEPVRVARRLARYCGMEGHERNIVLWLLKHTDMISIAQEAMRQNQSPATIKKAIEGDRRLKHVLV